MSYKCMKKIIIKRIFKDKSDILRWNYKRSFKAFLKELRDLESFTSLSFQIHPFYNAVQDIQLIAITSSKKIGKKESKLNRN